MSIKDSIGKSIADLVLPHLKNNIDIRDLSRMDCEEYNILERYLWYLGDEEYLADFYRNRKSTGTTIDVRKGYFYYNVSGNMRVVHSGMPYTCSDTLQKLLFNSGYKITSENEKVQELIKDIEKDNKLNLLHKEACRTQSWSGEVAYKISIDTKISKYPIVETCDKRQYEVYKVRGRVKEIRFKIPYTVEKAEYMLYEKYGYGYIKYELYKKTGYSWSGASLTDIEETKMLEDMKFDENIMLAKISDKNKSDYDGIMGEFDSLDEVWSNFMTDIRKSKTRTYVPETLASTTPDVNGFTFNDFTSTIIKVNADMGENADNKIETEQPLIRGEEHVVTTNAVTNNILINFGVSPTTLGIDNDISQVSGEARKEKEKASIRTRAELIEIWEPFFVELYDMILNANNLITNLKAKYIDYDLKVQFNDYLSSSFDERVKNVSVLKTDRIIDTEKALDMVFEDGLKDEEKQRMLNSSQSIDTTNIDFFGANKEVINSANTE